MTQNKTRQKTQKMQRSVFVQNRGNKRRKNGNICNLCHNFNFWTNQNIDLLSTSKWQPEAQFFERCIWKKWPEMVITLSFPIRIYSRYEVIHQTLDIWLFNLFAYWSDINKRSPGWRNNHLACLNTKDTSKMSILSQYAY